jgi:predicted RNase H-like nuclease (RuvC/YqgF family)
LLAQFLPRLRSPYCSKEAPKHALNAFETPPKRRRTIADVDEELRIIKNSIIELQSSNIAKDRKISNHNTMILKLRDDLADANKRNKELEYELRRRERH